MSVRRELFYLVELERERQDAKWGKQEHTDGMWMVIIMEELGEVAKAILQRQPAQIVIELVQTMAVIVAYLEQHITTEKTARGFRVHWKNNSSEE